MINDWPELAKALSADLRNLRIGAPDVMKTFSGMASSASAPGALDAKAKELIALAVSVAVHCDDCIAPSTQKPRRGAVQRARRFWRRSAWRSTWGLDLR
jgi:AhpD family alkylhydroperoxidase